MNSATLTFEKSFTRDWSLLLAELYHDVYVSECPKQIGWRLTETVYEGKYGMVTAYRSWAEVNSLKEAVISHLEVDSNWMNKRTQSFKETLLLLQAELDKFQQKSITLYLLGELLVIFQTVWQLKYRSSPDYVGLHFPV